MASLSIALATYNEEKNLPECLESVKNLADEMVIVDGESEDRTVEIAKKFGAKVKVTKNHPIFHVNKQMAIDMAGKDWILQLDADERVSKELSEEIKNIIEMSEEELEEYQKNIPNKELFLRHQKVLEGRDGRVGTEGGSYVAFFIPRLNFFLGRFMRHGGVYPDGVIRLFKKGKAYLPAKDVHEQFVVDGKVGWLSENLLHYDSPTFEKYLMRNKRYVSLMSKEFKNKKLGKSPLYFLNYVFLKPMVWFVLTFFRHKGFLDSWQGFVFSFFSALRFPRAYLQYIGGDK